MKPSLKMLVWPVVLVLAAGAGLALALGGDGDDSRPAAAREDVGKPLEVALAPAHGSEVSGTARFVPGRRDLKVAVKLDKRLPDTLPAHIHTGPCSDEPTMRNPRIWVTLTELIDGRSDSTVTLVTLPELRAESASINVHDPHNDLRPLACGDIPRG